MSSIRDLATLFTREADLKDALEKDNAKLEEKNAKLEEKNAKLKEKYAKLEEKNSTAVAKLEEKNSTAVAKLEEKYAKLEEKYAKLEEKMGKPERKRKRSPSPPPADGTELGGVVYEAVDGDASRRANCCSICGKCDGHNRSTCPSVIRSFKAY